MGVLEKGVAALAKWHTFSRAWRTVADTALAHSVRIIVGQFGDESHPLVTELSQLITTNVVWASVDVPYPICVLGEVNSFNAFGSGSRMQFKVKPAPPGCHTHLFGNIPAIASHTPQRFIPMVTKAIFSVEGHE